MKYVIIGNSAGAIGCIEGIRRHDTDGQIVLVAAEPHHTYSRPLISYLLQGKTDLERMKYRPDDFYKQMGVEAHLGVKVSAIDADKKFIKLGNGKKITYDKLLTATGSTPFVPPTKGLDTVDRQFGFMTLDDAQSLDAALDKTSRVLIVGAGLIGLKCAEGIAEKAGQITVVDMADRVLSSILTADAAAMVQKHLEAQGIKFVMNNYVAEFDGNTAILAKGGSRLDFDVLVMAVGVRPNISLLQAAGAKCDRGVLLNLHCQTSLHDVYAAGDCTQGYDTVSGDNKVLALLPNAYLQGLCAGENMAGAAVAFDTGMAMNSIGFWGLHIMTAGEYTGKAIVHKTANSYKCLYVKDNRLVGYIIVGDVARAGIYTSLIRSRRKLGTVDFKLLKDKPQLMAFGKGERAKMLAAGKEQ